MDPYDDLELCFEQGLLPPEWPVEEVPLRPTDPAEDEFLGFLAGDFAADSDFLNDLFGF